MRTRTYIDTNIFIYAIFHHSQYGKVCERILYDANKYNLEGYGSYLVAIELLGSISKVDPKVASNAVKDYLAMNIKLLEINEIILSIAGLINTIINIRYDAIHLALMTVNGIDLIITNDLDDWEKASQKFEDIEKILLKENFEIAISKLNVMSPKDYTRSFT